jgi:hypothetical protein
LQSPAEPPAATRYRHPGDLIAGYLLGLEPASWDAIHARARRAIRKARRAGVRIAPSEDLEAFRGLHFDPALVPDALAPEQALLLAKIDREVVGGIVIEAQMETMLLYRYGGTNDLGRRVQANSLLFWEVVERYSGSKYRYLDVGSSARPTLHSFKAQFGTSRYPYIVGGATLGGLEEIYTTGPLAFDHERGVEFVRRVPLAPGGQGGTEAASALAASLSRIGFDADPVAGAVLLRAREMVARRCRALGIAATTEGGLIRLPAHQGITASQADYIHGAVHSTVFCAEPE